MLDLKQKVILIRDGEKHDGYVSGRLHSSPALYDITVGKEIVLYVPEDKLVVLEPAFEKGKE